MDYGIVRDGNFWIVKRRIGKVSVEYRLSASDYPTEEDVAEFMQKEMNAGGGAPAPRQSQGRCSLNLRVHREPEVMT